MIVLGGQIEEISTTSRTHRTTVGAIRTEKITQTTTSASITAGKIITRTKNNHDKLRLSWAKLKLS